MVSSSSVSLYSYHMVLIHEQYQMQEFAHVKVDG